MKVFSFKQFLEEEDSKAIVQTGINSKGLDNTVTKEIINSRLVAATNHSYLTPYIALGNVARILAYVGIVVPQYTFLNREEGEVVFDAPQFGEVVGVNLDGTPAHPKTQYFIYFSYAMNEDGYYDCFAVIVDIDELDDILDEGDGEDMTDEVHNAQKLGEEKDDEEDDEEENKDEKSEKEDDEDEDKKEVNESQMKWREDTAHSEPHPDQDTIAGHKKAIEYWVDKERHAKTQGEKREAKRKMADHQGQVHSMEKQGVKEEAEVEEGFTKDWNKDKKRMYLIKKGYKTAATDPKSVKNTRAFAVRNARDMMKKEEATEIKKK